MNPIAAFQHLPTAGKLAIVGVPAAGAAVLAFRSKGKHTSSSPGKVVTLRSGRSKFTENLTIIKGGHPIRKNPVPDHGGHHVRPTRHEPGRAPYSWWTGRIRQTRNELGFIDKWMRDARRSGNTAWLGKLTKRRSHFRGQLKYQEAQRAKLKNTRRAGMGRRAS